MGRRGFIGVFCPTPSESFLKQITKHLTGSCHCKRTFIFWPSVPFQGSYARGAISTPLPLYACFLFCVYSWKCDSLASCSGLPMSVLLLGHCNPQIKPSFFKVWCSWCFLTAVEKWQIHAWSQTLLVWPDCLANVSQGPFFLWATLLGQHWGYTHISSGA